MQANAAKCTTYKKLIHKGCSLVHGDLSLVVDGFRCNQCDGTIPEAYVTENLLVDGKIYGCVKIIYFVREDIRDRKKWRRNVMMTKYNSIGKTDYKPIINIIITSFFKHNVNMIMLLAFSCSW